MDLESGPALASPAHISGCRGPGWATLLLGVRKTGAMPRLLCCRVLEGAQMIGIF